MFQEINNRRTPTMLLVGRDPGYEEVRAGKPFVGASGRQLDALLARAGIPRSKINITNLVHRQPPGNSFRKHRPEDVERGRADLLALIDELAPSLVVTLGNEAAWAVVPDWPSEDGTAFGAGKIQELRGYVWEGPVLTTLHPAATLENRDPSGLSAFLLQQDLVKARRIAKHGWNPPQREAIVVSTPGRAKEVVKTLRQSPITACDIETSGSETLLCVGFATSPHVAYIFTEAVFDFAFEVLQSLRPRKIFHNGHFDTYFLSTRCGVEVESYTDDTSLLWHSLWPEIAGATGRSEKSLRFLTSLVTDTPFYKDYSEEVAAMYRLNGLDCCVTYEVWEKLLEEAKADGVEGIYRHEVSLVPVLRKIQERGISIDVSLLEQRMEALSTRIEDSRNALMRIVEPLLHERRDRLEHPHLVFREKKCSCCRGAKKKLKRCWSCAGFESAPSKKDLLERYPKIDPRTPKASIEAQVFHECVACLGKGSEEKFISNPMSSVQQKDILYNVLKIPPRFKDGVETVDEGALKSILGSLDA